MSTEVSRYRENCALFTTPPIPAFEAALSTQADTCVLAGQNVDDNAMVRRLRFLRAARLLFVFFSLPCCTSWSRLQVCIAESLRGNSFITDLNLSGNRLSSAGVTDLATALAENKTLQTLKIKENPVGDEGISAIFTSVLDNPGSALSCVDCRCDNRAQCSRFTSICRPL